MYVLVEVYWMVARWTDGGKMASVLQFELV